MDRVKMEAIAARWGFDLDEAIKWIKEAPCDGEDDCTDPPLRPLLSH